MQQAQVAQQTARAKYNLALHPPHQPQEMRQMQLKLSQDKESIAAAQASLTLLLKGNPQQTLMLPPKPSKARSPASRWTLLTCTARRCCTPKT